MIEIAKASDIDAVVEIERRANMTPWSHQMLSESLSNNHGYQFFLLRRSNEQISAYLIALEVLDEVNLLHIAVDPSFQSQGIARRLMQYWLSRLNSEVKTVWLEVRESNEIAQSLYQSCGFQKVDERKKYYRIPDSIERETALIYCLKIKN